MREVIQAGGVLKAGRKETRSYGHIGALLDRHGSAKNDAPSQSTRQMQRSVRMGRFRVARGGLAWETNRTGRC